MYKVLAGCVLMLIAAVGGYFFAKQGDSGVEPKKIVIVEEIKQIAELSTISYHVTVTEERVRVKSESALHNDVDVLLIWSGVVKSGIDLEEIDKKDFVVDEESKVVKIHLPNAKITGVTPDDDGFTHYILKKYGTGLGYKPSGKVTQSWANEFKSQLSSRALELKINEKASSGATTMISSYLALLGYKADFIESDK